MRYPIRSEASSTCDQGSLALANRPLYSKIYYSRSIDSFIDNKMCEAFWQKLTIIHNLRYSPVYMKKIPSITGPSVAKHMDAIISGRAQVPVFTLFEAIYSANNFRKSPTNKTLIKSRKICYCMHHINSYSLCITLFASCDVVAK